ncbi:MBL fold metallo-hydrolase [Tumidithrix elongata RA019]|uniref:MBL fold metallo-hydrolase n=1 Tax=Tumidithrix elongata BACA0141 TaxID=2716417 RepID=A0AAW9PQR5_9CYAN|nr:MBL fold metallo-hydrolase [Tumidithrix elongata RA019]
MSISDSQFSIHFWGVRGSIATPGVSTVRYGGNTPCVEMRCHGKRLIFDGGTGLRVLGQHLLKEMPIDAHLFFTHSHWDHIQGFPFFTPAFIKGNTFHIYGKVAPNGQTMQDRLEEQMLHPNFPVPLRIMGAAMHFRDVEVPSKIDLGNGVTVEPGMLNHPGEATGYRVSWGNESAVYATDTEHFADRIDESLVHLARDADVLIIDATYSDEQYWSKTSPKVGWGHSTWQEAVKLAEAANVKTLVIFHHDPVHSDDYLDEIGRQVQEKFPSAVMAREGMAISIPTHSSIAIT